MLLPDAAEELFKATETSPNCHLTFKTNTDILISRGRDYVGDKQHIHTWVLFKSSLPSAHRAAAPRGHRAGWLGDLGTSCLPEPLHSPGGHRLTEKQTTTWCGSCPIHPFTCASPISHNSRTRLCQALGGSSCQGFSSFVKQTLQCPPQRHES